MIELYDVNDISIGTNLSFDSIFQNAFIFAIVIIAISILISLVVWFIGARIKSENVIKFGIKSFIIATSMQTILLAIPIIINFTNSKF